MGVQGEWLVTVPGTWLRDQAQEPMKFYLRCGGAGHVSPHVTGQNVPGTSHGGCMSRRVDQHTG